LFFDKQPKLVVIVAKIGLYGRMKEHFLFMADVAGSTGLSEGAHRAVFERIDQVVADLNESTPAVVPLTRQYGDEVSGLYVSPESAYAIAVALRDAIHPQAGVRFVFVRGKIGQINADISQVGGAIFKIANKRMQQAKRESRFGLWSIDQSCDAQLDALTGASAHIWRGMTSYQWAIYQLRRKGHAYVEIEKILQKQQQSISRAAKQSGVELVLEAEAAIGDILKNFD
jgi:hypothetical protein